MIQIYLGLKNECFSKFRLRADSNAGRFSIGRHIGQIFSRTNIRNVTWSRVQICIHLTYIGAFMFVHSRTTGSSDLRMSQKVALEKKQLDFHTHNLRAFGGEFSPLERTHRPANVGSAGHRRANDYPWPGQTRAVVLTCRQNSPGLRRSDTPGVPTSADTLWGRLFSSALTHVHTRSFSCHRDVGGVAGVFVASIGRRRKSRRLLLSVGARHCSLGSHLSLSLSLECVWAKRRRGVKIV